MGRKKKEKYFDHWDEIANEIKGIFDRYDSEDHTSLAQEIAVEATIWGANTTYEGIGILDVAKRDYEFTCLKAMQEEQKEKSKLRVVKSNSRYEA